MEYAGKEYAERCLLLFIINVLPVKSIFLSSRFSKLNLVLFVVEGSHSYLELFTESKNINPSLSYRVLKIGKYILIT